MAILIINNNDNDIKYININTNNDRMLGECGHAKIQQQLGKLPSTSKMRKKEGGGGGGGGAVSLVTLL